MTKASNIIIFGAPGSGVSTLTENLSAHLKWNLYHLTSKSRPPDSGDPLQIEKAQLDQLQMQISSNAGCLIEGSPCLLNLNLSNVNGVIYVQAPRIQRLKRLREREMKLQGSVLLDEDSREFKKFNRYMYWVSQFDQAGIDRQSKILHQRFLNSLDIPLLQANGLLDQKAILQECLQWLTQLHND